jgi:intracellular sulfur oxidation DsrE/DsrF family protein
MQTNDCEGLTSARAVWDFMTGDSRRFLDRVRLMMLAMRRFREQNITPEFVVLLHGGATKFAVRDLSGTKFAADDAQDFPEIHAALTDFTSQGGRVEVCGIAMDRSLIGRAALMPYADVEENVFLNSIALQNRGYAYVLVT